MAEAAGSGEAGMGRAAGSGSGRGCGRPAQPSTSRKGGLGPGGGDEEPERQRVASPDGDDTSRRLIRHQYRELINTVQQNREAMLNSKSNKLTEALEEANILFTGVSRAREAALDAQFLVLASNLGKEKANELHSDMTAFDLPAFAEDLLTFMGLNRIQDNDSDEEGSTGGYLPNDAWHKLGAEAETYFRRAPSFHYMLGSFSADPPVPKQRIERQKRKTGREERSAMPAQLRRMEESHQEATEKEVERILGLLQTHFNNDPEIPISFFDFVIDPNSFARTVENIFHVSFIIRDGFARIKLDQDRLPIIEPSNDNEGRENDQNAQVRHQAIISLSHQEWKDIVETFEITESMIDPPTHIQDNEIDPA
ncbi:PREDICTED: non-structural maintenance of chromosomes element 4 homolog A [Gavialis gangeticus]|uniref:non-structural maintenance of chromosomes element 4 homolog A n=1 Tax=Gavialis gangeticus TaxID=94835 RepID=UPI00092EA238|nr:PREDICTED: non-structural maintenance of chromosomes element 4 homolog A [Gavialis gangeticus]